EPAMYVRWEGDVIDLLTGKRLPDAESFDANNVIKRTILVGSSYFDIGNRLADIAMLDTSRKDGVHAQLFYGVSRADGLHSIYVGLKDPSAQAERDCSIYPIYFSSRGLVQGEKVVLNRWRPFAWLRHVRINLDGSTNLETSPRDDERFKRELAEF